MKSTVSVIILTSNERLHIRRCIERVRPVATEIFVVDCHSTDGTQAIARGLGATVVEHDWPGNQATQFNWALDNLPLTGEWVLRLDADEYLTPELVAEVSARLDTLPPEVTGGAFQAAAHLPGQMGAPRRLSRLAAPLGASRRLPLRTAQDG